MTAPDRVALPGRPAQRGYGFAGVRRIAGVGLLMRIAGLVMQFAIMTVLARLLGAQGWGTYAYIVAVVTVIAIPTQLGLPQWLVRTSAALAAEGRPHAVLRVLAKALAIVLVGSALVVPLGWIWLTNAGAAAVDGAEAFWGLCLVPLVALAGARSAVLRGLGRGIAGQLPEQVIMPLALLILLLAAAWSATLDPATALQMRGLAAVLGLAVGAFLLARALRGFADVEASHTGNTTPAICVRSIAALALVGGIWILNANLDVIMVAQMMGEREAGVYRLAANCAALAGVAGVASNAAIGPAMAALYQAGEHDRLCDTICRMTRLTVAAVVSGGVGLLIVGAWAIPAIWGAEFAAAYVPMAILLFGHVSTFAFGPGGLLLNMTGREKATLPAAIVSVAINIALNFWLIGSLGMIGAALATVAATATFHVGMWVQARRLLSIDTMRWIGSGRKRRDQRDGAGPA